MTAGPSHDAGRRARPRTSREEVIMDAIAGFLDQYVAERAE